MKVLYSGYAPYRYLPEDFGEHYESVVNTPYFELVEPAKMHSSLHAYAEEPLRAARCGFDGVTVTEHSPGHIPHVEQLERTLELVSDFLRS